MQQVVHNLRNGRIKLAEIPDAKVKRGYLLVRNVFSVVSIGTEMMKVRAGKKSLLGKAKERPDQVKQVIEHVKQAGLVATYKRVINKLDKMTPIGYSAAGIVVEVGDGVTGFKVGDRVACGGSGHAELITVPKNLCALAPDNVSMESVAFTTLGAIAIHGVRQSGAKVGENIVVIGLGLVGQIVAKVLSAAGCNVVGIDLEQQKLKIAAEGGIDLAINRNDSGLVSRIKDFSLGLGVDAEIITAGTSSNDPIELAPKILRDRGRLVVLGISKMDIPWRTYYEKEIDVRLSRSYGPGRYDAMYEENGVDYPVGYVRWTQQRNMVAFLNLVAKNRIILDNIITHRFPFREAEKVYERLNDGSLNGALGVLFEYEVAKKAYTRPALLKLTPPKSIAGTINIGMIGAGNYTRNTILPIIKKIDSLNLKSIATETGISAKDAQIKYGFENVYTEITKVCEDPEINTVIVATRHDTHAGFVAEALKNKKNVFVEKPLALSLRELENIEDCYSKSGAILMVGYNRRFSPHVVQIKRFFKDRQSPLALNYRVNAGMIPNDHWYQDPVKGGGRIVGECCHFVDVVQFITEEEPIRVFAESLSTENRILNNDDTANLLIKFSRGSIATINYFSCGDTTYPKERLEVLGENSIAVLDDYKTLELIRNGKKKVIKTRGQDKGHKEEFKAFFAAVSGKAASPITFDDMKNATLVTIAATESFKKGVPVNI